MILYFYQQQRAYKYWFVFVWMLCGCTFVRYTESVSGQPQASYYSFSKDTSSPSLGHLDTSFIYVNAQDWVRTYQNGKVEKVFSYEYLRFGKNRIAFFSNDNIEPFNKMNIDFIEGQYCYYKVEGDKLQVEIYNRHLKKFIILTANIYPDRIHFYKEHLRIPTGGKGKLDLVYYKQPIKATRPLVWPK